MSEPRRRKLRTNKTPRAKTIAGIRNETTISGHDRRTGRRAGGQRTTRNDGTVCGLGRVHELVRTADSFAHERLRFILVSGWALALAFTACSALGFLFFNHTIAGVFLTEPKAAALTASLLLISAAFQVSDAMQVSSGGALRGLGDVKVPVWVAFVAYWIIAIPVGWLLAFPAGMGVAGMWWGITLGLTTTALALGVRVWKKTAY